MKELSRTELRRIVAEVEGLECAEYGGRVYLGNGRPHYGDLYTPDTDANQALDALKAWMNPERDYDITSGDDGACLVTLYDEQKVKGSLVDWIPMVCLEAKTFELALCLALASAVTGEQCTLQED